MAVHLPITNSKRSRELMAAGHILGSKDGKPIIIPTQDMLIGIYYLYSKLQMVIWTIFSMLMKHLKHTN